jgi:pyrimidine operon attenuation protein/uracil phosphoribosyltransferase
MVEKKVLDSVEMGLMIKRLSYQVVEDHADASKLVIIGIQPRGIPLCSRMVQHIEALYGCPVANGKLDITFYRDDVRNEIMEPRKTDLEISLEGREVVIVDDVLYTGRTTRAALDALLDFGRPSRVSLCTLIDRSFNREIPIQPDYTGRVIDTIFSQKVKVRWKESEGADEVYLLG